MHIYRKKKKNTVQLSSSLNKMSIQLGKNWLFFVYTHTYMCILYTRVASNIRVTCTYVSLTKHSTAVTTYHVKVTILCCIMNELRQLYYSNQLFLHFLSKVRNKKKPTQLSLNVQYYKSNANKLSSNVSFDGLRILIYSR